MHTSGSTASCPSLTDLVVVLSDPITFPFNFGNARDDIQQNAHKNCSHVILKSIFRVAAKHILYPFFKSDNLSFNWAFKFVPIMRIREID